MIIPRSLLGAVVLAGALAAVLGAASAGMSPADIPPAAAPGARRRGGGSAVVFAERLSIGRVLQGAGEVDDEFEAPDSPPRASPPAQRVDSDSSDFEEDDASSRSSAVVQLRGVLPDGDAAAVRAAQVAPLPPLQAVENRPAVALDALPPLPHRTNTLVLEGACIGGSTLYLPASFQQAFVAAGAARDAGSVLRDVAGSLGVVFHGWRHGIHWKTFANAPAPLNAAIIPPDMPLRALRVREGALMVHYLTGNLYHVLESFFALYLTSEWRRGASLTPSRTDTRP